MSSNQDRYLRSLLEQSAASHDHLCPRQVLGARMGLLAGRLLSLEMPRHDKRLLTLVETDGCFADGVAVATGCELGHRTLRLIDHGKVAATFVDTQTERALRVVPHPDSRHHAIELCAAAPSRWHGYLEGYQQLDDQQLFVVQWVAIKFSITELISDPDRRALCDVCGEEIINGREIVDDDRIVCQACAGNSYYLNVKALEIAPERMEIKSPH